MLSYSRLLFLTVLTLLIASIAYVPSAADRAYGERMAAWHETMVSTDELRPNSCVSTYVKEYFGYMDTYLLAKLSCGVEDGGAQVWTDRARDVQVEDTPGGVRASFRLGRVKVRTDITPLMVGRGTPEQEGAVVYSVSTYPATPVLVRCGGGGGSNGVGARSGLLRGNDAAVKGEKARVTGDVCLMAGPAHPFTVAVRGGAMTVDGTPETGQSTIIRFEKGSGKVIVAFAKDSAKAESLAAMDADAAVSEVHGYYRKLLQCKIESPNLNMNSAFQSALVNLEYNWLAPYGWTECIHHWYALWHMQHTGAAEWIGEADRSRLCNVTTAEHLLDDGSIPQFNPNGTTRKDFGGSNQFFAWQVRHYWKFTGDRGAVQEIAPKLDEVIQQTFSQYDPDGDGLLQWGQQTGNQEDYVSTPFDGTSCSVEGINMLKTAAELWRALGQDAKARGYETRAAQMAALLRRKLWQPELGRYAFYTDPLGVTRPDGQYHTLIYPVIWGLTDPLDSYTSIGQMRDRLTGAGGEVYCSNNFPNHVVCTCGPQAGVAQQPWAAWGLAAVGLRNETYRPLKAAADWVMDANHRGSWPEISYESTAAYFSPPAGLYVQSVVEALFGLSVNKPAGYLRIAPSFPDHWPSARLVLPEYSATYQRSGNTLSYRVTSGSPLARKLRWMLPPCRVTGVTVNSKRSQFGTTPGVGCVTLELDTAPSRDTAFKVTFEPLQYTLTVPKSIAEGDAFQLKASGCRIESIDDRCGVLSACRISDGSTVSAAVRKGLLEPYSGYGRLGQMNFSRRTFFLRCSSKAGVEFWAPVDLTVLPPVECAAVGGLTLSGKSGVLRLLVRNNSFRDIRGSASVAVAGLTLPVNVALPPRSETTYTASVPADHLALLSPGENHADVLLPNGRRVDVVVDASQVFETVPELSRAVRSRIESVPLPADALIGDTDWTAVRRFTAYGHMPWAGSRPPMEAVKPGDLTVPGLPAVSFRAEDRRFVPVSWQTKPVFTLPLSGRTCRKVYLLVIPFLDNHDTFAPVARVDVRMRSGAITSRTLRFPGDLDWWCPPQVVGDFATCRTPRPGRHDLLPLLSESSGDWPRGEPPAFPQPEYWANCLAYPTASSVMNVVEIDLGRGAEVESLSVSALAADPALGVVAVSVENVDGYDSLRGTPWMPPAAFRPPTTVFDFDKAGDLKGWKTEGAAFSVAPVPSLFLVPTLNSLAAAGESATGKAISPDFTIGAEDRRLLFEYQGGISRADDGPGCLRIELVDSRTNEVLRVLRPSGSHVLREGSIPVDGLGGRAVHLVLTDLNTDTSYAWLGVRRVRLSAR